MENTKLQPLPALAIFILNTDTWSLENDDFEKV